MDSDWEQMKRVFREIDRRQRSTVTVVRDRETPIRNLHPHYTNDVFKNAQTVYLARDMKTVSHGSWDGVKGATYNYSDRLMSWHYGKIDAAREAANETGHAKDSAAWLERYLQVLTSDDIKLVHIMAGFNLSNGFDYQVYGYFTTQSDNVLKA
jgi:hypothetical protein